MSKILITGATGGLGSAVATLFKKQAPSSDIAVLVRDGNSEKALRLAGQGFETRIGSYDDKDSLLKAFDGVDVLYFVSGSDVVARVPQHQNVVQAAKEAGVDHIFYTSASLNDLSEDAPLYGAMSAHIQTEEWIKASGIKYTLLRHNLYSEVIAMFLGTKEQLLAGKTVFLPTGSGRTAFVSRAELAEAGAKLLARPSAHVNKIYELNGNEKITFAQIAGYLSEISGQEIGYVSPDVKTFEDTLTKYGVPAEYIGMMTVFGLAIADGVFDAPTTDLDKILGRKSQPVAEFLRTVYG
ncbi:MAG: SDR family oxidoreductase [Saprospiraceae bacterium]|nr:SDR family oxidoreductase [Lewinella sp.]